MADSPNEWYRNCSPGDSTSGPSSTTAQPVQWRPGGRGAFGPCPPPPKGQSPGTSISFGRPQTEAGPPGPAWAPKLRSIFYQVSGPRRHQGSAKRTRAPRDGARKTNHGPARQIRAHRTNQGPRNGLGPRNTNQGSERRIRARMRNQNPAGPIRAPQDGSGPRGTKQSPARRTRAPQGRIRAPMDEPGLRRMNQVFAGRIRAPQDEPGSRRANQGPM